MTKKLFLPAVLAAVTTIHSVTFKKISPILNFENKKNRFFLNDQLWKYVSMLIDCRYFIYFCDQCKFLWIEIFNEIAKLKSPQKLMPILKSELMFFIYHTTDIHHNCWLCVSELLGANKNKIGPGHVINSLGLSDSIISVSCIW